MNSNENRNTQKSFSRHLVIYIGVNLLLLILDISDGGSLWFFYPLIGWGILLALQFMKAK